ncbi:MAG: hypothetical protein ACKJSK_13975 [Roseibacillus sp.]|jgi:hypothetical protein
MLPPNAKLIEGNLSTTETEERVVVLLDKVRVQAAGARSFRNGILFKAPYRMEGLDDKAARDWTMDSDEGYVYIQRTGGSIPSEFVEKLQVEEDAPPEPPEFPARQ